jgi:steroid 5-alpha reductase family enzyme
MKIMIPDVIQFLSLAWAIAATVMFALWLVQRRTSDAGIVDIGWAATLAGLALLYAALGDAPPLRRLLVGAMGFLWGARLALHLHVRNHGRPEDGRYRQLRKDWAPREQWGLFKFFQFQAAAAVFFSIPFVLPSLNDRAGLSAVEIAGAILWAIALIGETSADLQLERFKKKPGSKGRVCRDGLWRLSRHPNYFFESLIWIALALFALPAPGGLVALLCPSLILYFLFKVTGIPATEAQALRTKGDDYRAYQRTTSAFVPWFPRK